jgi:hypothetical protein
MPPPRLNARETAVVRCPRDALLNHGGVSRRSFATCSLWRRADSPPQLTRPANSHRRLKRTWPAVSKESRQLREVCRTDARSGWLLDSEVVFAAARLRFRAIPTSAPDILSRCRANQYKLDRPHGPFDVFHQVDWTRNIRRSRPVILVYPTEAAKD